MVCTSFCELHSQSAPICKHGNRNPALLFVPTGVPSAKQKQKTAGEATTQGLWAGRRFPFLSIARSGNLTWSWRTRPSLYAEVRELILAALLGLLLPSPPGRHSPGLARPVKESLANADISEAVLMCLISSPAWVPFLAATSNLHPRGFKF